ncbi:hypothetical protein CCP4SC76_3290006 [Gammaproteobacteria bacterium]
MGLEKSYYPIAEVADMLGCKKADILQSGLLGHIQLFFLSDKDISYWPYDDENNKSCVVSYEGIKNNLGFSIPTKFVTLTPNYCASLIKYGKAIVDRLEMPQLSENLAISTWSDDLNYSTEADHVFARVLAPIEISLDHIYLQKDAVEQLAESEKPLAATERDTLLTSPPGAVSKREEPALLEIMKALITVAYGDDMVPDLKSTKATRFNEILSDLQGKGLTISDRTLRGYIKRLPD